MKARPLTFTGGQLVLADKVVPGNLRCDADRIVALGADVTPQNGDEVVDAKGMLIAPGSPFTASMLRDLQAGQRTEHQHILGAMAERGIALGLPMDLVRLAHTHLAVQAGRG